MTSFSAKETDTGAKKSGRKVPYTDKVLDRTAASRLVRPVHPIRYLLHFSPRGKDRQLYLL